ncbi:hypothetical protein [Thermoflavimicrobium dichotomicum]|uniref:Uncharacterized protein n=1 Tax=Thermoflavimicrobium dichotomicum TaxID=46223 RepID=A0A1I3UV20_9BACL|nr:hypothetical protein [Thermoflavimicrobium dichotomicum]SFJ86742.1 hypothetical protein SAMN05421852_12822 [Thermoflavimicrobium dichotomicum]
MSVTNPSIPASYQQAVLRWKQGHHVFHVILVTMNTCLEESLRALNQQDWSRLIQLLERLATLYDAATATMKYSSNFSRKYYEEVIRPSMMPPFLKPGFSGKLNREHNVMLDLFQTLRAELKKKEELPLGVEEAWRKLVQSQKRNRKHHGLVCQQFVDDGVSLLQEFYRSQTK